MVSLNDALNTAIKEGFYSGWKGNYLKLKVFGSNGCIADLMICQGIYLKAIF